MIHIACCSNEKMAPMFGVVMTSVGVNVKSDDVMMYLLHNGMKDKTKKRLHKIAERFNVSLRLIEIDADILKHCPVDASIHYGNIMMYARLLLSSMLPDLDKVIYLDCDLVVNGDLKDLWDFDVNGVAVAMAPDHLYKDATTLERLKMTNGEYLNSGVIVMNLEYWRKHNVQNRVLTFIEENGKQLIYFDQDALNVTLQNERRKLPIKYDCTPYHLLRNLNNFPSEIYEEIHRARIAPTIFHYMGPTKPWSLGSYVPGKELFKKYQRFSGWRHYVVNKLIFKRILYSLIPILKKKAWENKTYIDGWENLYTN
ncbi:MAG: glycosyltransferase family 8 protein [Prevotella sp.]|nr:glycosyltransferase family 8 protein [Prevotella sp.]